MTPQSINEGKVIATNSSILTGKCAVVFGAGGSVGSAVAREFSVEGAEVYLAGRTKSNVENVRSQIDAAGGRAHSEVIDALDDAAVNDYLDEVAKEAGKIDVVFNAMGPLAAEYGNGKHAVDLPIDEFMVPLTTVVKSHFITARAAARHMVKQRSGVIILLTGSPARGHVEGATAIGAAFGAIESLTENLAIELGSAGVRVVCLRTTVNVDSRTIQQMVEAIASNMNAPKEQIMERMASLNFLKTRAMTSDTAKAAAFLASDRARLMTGTVMNSTAGAALD